MQNAVNKEGKDNATVSITSSHVTDAIRRVHDSNAMFTKQVLESASKLDNV